VIVSSVEKKKKMSAVKKVKIDADAAKPEDDKIDQRIEAAEKNTTTT